MILCAVGVSMIVPEFLPAAAWQTYSIFNILIMLLLYALFLRLQTGRYAAFFSFRYAHRAGQGSHAVPDETEVAGDPAAMLQPPEIRPEMRDAMARAFARFSVDMDFVRAGDAPARESEPEAEGEPEPEP